MSLVIRENNKFEVISQFTPSGDQPKAIELLADRINNGDTDVVLLGATGTGKSATTAWLIEKVQRPTLVLEPNKTLAAQISTEFKELMPHNAVEYFVSYYDYYQPEAYIAQTDTFIEKDSSINDDIERLRHKTTSSLLTRNDVVVVSSVSCIYGLGTPEEYLSQMLYLKVGESISRDVLLSKFISMQYQRNDIAFERGVFRIKGDTVEIIPVYEELAIRLEFFGDELDKISILHPISAEKISEQTEIMIFPASHYVSSDERTKKAIKSIREEMEECVAIFKKKNKLVEAQRLEMRTEFDLEMIEQTGSCKGIENYSRHFDGRAAGSPPNTLLDFFPKDYLLVIDESHVTVPQIGAMFEGDASRKRMLIDHGFRLPSAADNRPLKWGEFLERIHQTVYLSATPGTYEKEKDHNPVELIIRPTGLVDPQIDVRKTDGQIADLLSEIKEKVNKKERVLITTLTKKMAEDLSVYLTEKDIKTEYLHSDVDTLKRVELLTQLRKGVFDVLVGINLLREGLDLPEVSLVAILDADKQGFLRSARSLIQTIGRAARNVSGKVIMYADTITPQMREAIDETNRRRKLQLDYNKKHNIDPKPLMKKISDVTETISREEADTDALLTLNNLKDSPQSIDNNSAEKIKRPQKELINLIEDLQSQMKSAASSLNFELAARYRDEIAGLKKELRAMDKIFG